MDEIVSMVSYRDRVIIACKSGTIYEMIFDEFNGYQFRRIYEMR